jgi:hypothetical protein
MLTEGDFSRKVTNATKWRSMTACNFKGGDPVTPVEAIH